MPLQIWGDFRKHSLSRHRLLGWLIVGLLSIGMTTSFYIARPMREVEEGGGMTSEVGFYGMALATSYCVLMGLLKIRQKKVDEHRQWMIRAYGTMWGAFFWFRIAMVAFLPLMPDKYHHGLGLISNLSWMSGWIGADIALSLTSSNADSIRSKSGGVKKQA